MLLEEFLRDRAAEWSHFLTSARINPSQLPGGAVSYQDRMVEALPGAYRRTAVVNRSILAQGFSKTVASLAGNSLESHEILFDWSGSNIDAADVESILKLVGIGKAWDQMTVFWKILDRTAPNQSARNLLNEVTSSRHRAAHALNPALAQTTLLALSRNARLTAILIDALVSTALVKLARGDVPGNAISNSIRIRRIERDSSRWSEYGPKATRAFRRHPDLQTALTEAAGRAKARDEFVVAVDGGEIKDWRSLI
ncbi:hypothetical protein [Frondihabitans australicus]|uniref:hypothetical protein n=1 Tax=Frondihabitans australicus TaxID=386892 RepID=UPI0011C4561B|nr:hypothetical protein [Frondihabitans australicus]